MKRHHRSSAHRRPSRPQDAAALSFRKTASPSGALAEGVGWVVGFDLGGRFSAVGTLWVFGLIARPSGALAKRVVVGSASARMP